MRRGKLISRGHRQLWLAHRVLTRQPLVARLTKHQRLSRELGLPALSARVAQAPGRTSSLPGRNLDRQEQSYLSPNGMMFRPALVIQAEDAYAIATTPEEPGHLLAQQAVYMSQPPEQELGRRPITATVNEPSVAEVVSEPEIVVPSMPGPKVTPSEQEPEAEALVARNEEAPQAIRSDESESVRSEAPSERKDKDEYVQPSVESAKPPIEIIKPRRPRRSIEELPAQGHDLTPPSQSAKEAHEMRRNAQGTKAYEKSQASASSKGEETIHADELFAPSNTDRSPQAWLARLIGKSVPPSEPDTAAEPDAAASSTEDTIASPSTTLETLHSERNAVGAQFIAPVPAAPARRQPDIVGTPLVGVLAPGSPDSRPAADVPVPDSPTSRPSVDAPVPDSPASRTPHAASSRMQGNEAATREGSTIVPLAGTNVTDARRGEGGGVGLGGPLWSPAVDEPGTKATEVGDTGDHKGTPPNSTSPLHLRTSFKNQRQSQQPGETDEAQRNAAPDVPQARPVPTPVSMRTRRFLQPLVGIDPASVRVHRDAEAIRLTDAYQADAISVGNDVEIAAGHTDDTPETLGLLAHEFTHVARQREPNFIPPVVRSASPANSSQPVSGQPSTFSPSTVPVVPISPEPSMATSEEALALHVERQVRRTAREHQGQFGQSEQSKLQTGSISSASASGPVAASLPTTPTVTNDPWGGLPAPWEPLPNWLASPPNAATSATPATPVSSPAQPPQSMRGTARSIVGTPLAGVLGGGSAAGVLGGGGSAASAGVQRAGEERSLGIDAAPPPPLSLSSSSAAANISPAPEPDLDDLARQVYSRLKRRLEVERQRFS